MDTALKLFQEKGYDKVSIKQICSEMGFGRSTFYYHFRTKEQVLEELYHSDRVFTTETMSWILTAPSNLERAFRIQLAYERHIDSIESPEAIMHYLASGMTKGFSEMVISTEKVNALLVPVIEQCQQSGEITNPADPIRLCEIAIQLQCGILMQYCFRNGQMDRQQALLDGLHALYLIKEETKG